MKIDEMPDVSDAMAKLDAAEAAEQTIPAVEQVQADGDTQATPPEPTPVEVAPQPDPLPSDTLAAAEPSKPAEPTKTQDKQTPFAKDQVRRDTSWKALNAEKTKLAQEQAQFNEQKAAHERQVQQANLKSAKAQQQFTPEQIEQRATVQTNDTARLTEQAEAWEARAEKLENEGKLIDAGKAKIQAELLREQAMESKASAKMLRAHADRLRQTPPDKTLEQHKQQLDQQMRGYTLKAVEQWPEFGKQGSEFQKSVAQGLQEARKMGLEVNDNPALLYYAARLVAGESAAARVPVMEKELGELRAKVKELEGLTAPGGGKGSAQRQPSGNLPKNDVEEESELRAIAATL